MCEGHVQEGWTMWRRKPGFDVCSGASSARGGRAHLVVSRLYAVAVHGTCSHTAECLLQVVVSPAAAATQLLAGHGMIDVAALHTFTTLVEAGMLGLVRVAPKRNQPPQIKSASDRRR